VVRRSPGGPAGLVLTFSADRASHPGSRMAQCRQARCGLIEYLVGGDEQRRRHVETERLRGLPVDHHLKSCGLLNGQIGWLFPLKNAT
jgi:hypothetical protein